MSKETTTTDVGFVWAERVIFTVLICIGAAFANTIYGIRTHAEVIVMPWETIPCLLYMIVIIFVCYLLHDALAKVLPFTVPTVLYISLIAAILSFPGIDCAIGSIFGMPDGLMATTFAKFYGLLPLCTPILAYAGISSGKELKTFKELGFAIICVAILTFVGTYFGSAIIAQLILSGSGVI